MGKFYHLKNNFLYIYAVLLWTALIFFTLCAKSMAAPYAAMVMDARTGKILHSENADTPLHPASLTKMMTLYIAFEALENNEISPDKMVQISRNAASEPASKLGLKTGQYIKFRDLVRSAAVRSANDSATAIAEAISGSENAFIFRMNATAKALGLVNTKFKNAHGLTQEGHLSTARDMTFLGRALLYHYPDYYHLFGRYAMTTSMGKIYNTNRSLLNSFKGADGIKTGYTKSAGYNLVSSAKRDNKRIIATVFGGKSGANRNARIEELLRMGFERASANTKAHLPKKPNYKSIKGYYIQGFTGAIKRSTFPIMRPKILSSTHILQTHVQSNEMKPTKHNTFPKETLSQDSISPRLSSSPEQKWSITLGTYPTSAHAEETLLKSSFFELDSLIDAAHMVQKNARGFQAIFMNLSLENATRACSRLRKQGQNCAYIPPNTPKK